VQFVAINCLGDIKIILFTTSACSLASETYTGEFSCISQLTKRGT
jgi:hypothetical protein